jgi:WD40 repeat protein
MPLSLALRAERKTNATVSGRVYESVTVWDADDGTKLFSQEANGGSVTFSPDGKQLLGHSGSYRVTVWDADKGQEIVSLKGHGGEVRSVAYSPDGKRIVRGEDQTVKVWDAAKAQVLRNLTGVHVLSTRLWTKLGSGKDGTYRTYATNTPFVHAVHGL